MSSNNDLIVSMNCPITLERMVDPHIMFPCGHSCEKTAIDQLTAGSRGTAACPLDRRRIESVAPNRGLRILIEQASQAALTIASRVPTSTAESSRTGRQSAFGSVQAAAIRSHIRLDLGNDESLLTPPSRLISLFQEASQDGRHSVIRAILIDPQFRGMSFEQRGLAKALCSAARGGHSSVVGIILNGAVPGEIEANGESSLAEALCAAAQGGHLTTVQIIQAHPLYWGISEDSLGEAIRYAAQEHHLSVVKAFIDDARFGDILLEGEFGLGVALCAAIYAADQPIIKTMVENWRFRSIPDEGEYGLYDALERAFDVGGLSMLIIILERLEYGFRSDSSPAQRLGLALRWSAKTLQVPAIKAVITDPGFRDMPLYGNYGLSDMFYAADAFHAAAANGKSSVVEAMMDNPRFHELGLKEQYAFAHAFHTAAENGHDNVVQVMMNNPRFEEMWLDAEYGFVEALCAAAKNGHLFAVTTMMKSDWFYKICEQGPQGLQTARHAAASALQLSVLETLLTQDIDEGNHLGHILSWAIQENQVSVLRKIMSDPKFQNIPIDGIYGFANIFVEAAKLGRWTCVNLMMANDRFESVPATGENGLGCAFRWAAANGHLVSVRLMMAHQRFQEIPSRETNGLLGAIAGAALSGHTPILKAIMSSPRILEIPTGLLYDLGAIVIKVFVASVMGCRRLTRGTNT